MRVCVSSEACIFAAPSRAALFKERRALPREASLHALAWNAVYVSTNTASAPGRLLAHVHRLGNWPMRMSALGCLKQRSPKPSAVNAGSRFVGPNPGTADL